MEPKEKEEPHMEPNNSNLPVHVRADQHGNLNMHVSGPNQNDEYWVRPYYEEAEPTPTPRPKGINVDFYVRGVTEYLYVVPSYERDVTC